MTVGVVGFIRGNAVYAKLRFILQEIDAFTSKRDLLIFRIFVNLKENL